MAYARVTRRRPRKRQGFWNMLSLTNRIIAINVLVFVFIFPFLFSERLGPIVIEYVAINPSLFLQGFVWTLITSMFMHGSFFHLFANMISIFFIGNFIERLIGRKRFIWFYMIAGFVGGLMFVGLAYVGQFVPWGASVFGGVDAFAVGASGALFGVGGLLAVLIPRMRVLLMFIIPMPMWIAMIVLMFGLWAVSIGANLPLGNTAHFGGLVVGVAYGVYLRNKYPRKIRMLNKMF